MRRRNGFTLIELLVVVAIIVALIAILVPALSGAKKKGYETKTRAIMSSLSSAMTMYHGDFGAYPGPLPATSTVTGGNSATENMLVGLNGATGTGPTDNSKIKPDGTAEKLAPYYATGKNASIATINGKSVVVDGFPDAMPILYFRRTASVNSPVALANPTAAGAPAAYYLDENKFFFALNSITSASGTLIDQQSGQFFKAQSSPAAKTQALADLSELVQTGTGATATARGGFLLMAAGSDGIYGKVVHGTGTGAVGISDDYSLVGGD